jgi:hypothetical protein
VIKTRCNSCGSSVSPSAVEWQLRNELNTLAARLVTAKQLASTATTKGQKKGQKELHAAEVTQLEEDMRVIEALLACDSTCTSEVCPRTSDSGNTSEAQL